MRIVIAPDKFKGCLSSAEVCAAMAQGTRRAAPGAVVESVPLADGGEGMVEAMVTATGGKFVTRLVTGPLVSMKVEARFGFLGDGRTAVIEMASASGLALLNDKQRNPMRTTTYGTGELLCHAAALGARRIILGIGGSATVDGGLGAAQACGATITFANGAVYSAGDRRLTGEDVANVLRIAPMRVSTGPGDLSRDDPPAAGPLHLSRVDAPAAPAPRRRSLAADVPDFSGIELIVACDVGNPLFGDHGAARIFGPQKGATDEQVQRLDAALRQFANRCGRLDLADRPGAGAAGGLGFGMMALFGATIRDGIDLVLDTVDLRGKLIGADLCLTGEGRLDGQSAAGKTPVGVGRLCRSMNVPCIALAGSIGPGAEAVLDEGIDAYFPILDRPMTLAEAMADAPRLLAMAAEMVVRQWSVASGRLSKMTGK